MGRFYAIDADDDFLDRVPCILVCTCVGRDVDHRHRLHSNILIWQTVNVFAAGLSSVRRCVIADIPRLGKLDHLGSWVMALRTLTFDGVIVGGGGAGMRAGLQLARSGLKTAVISKVFPTRSHTVSA